MDEDKTDEETSDEKETDSQSQKTTTNNNTVFYVFIGRYLISHFLIFWPNF